MASAAENVRALRPQITLDVGGATADSSEIKGLSWAAGTKELDREFKKGDDVRIVLTGRVVGVPIDDKYDGHGNVRETIRGHKIRVDDVELVELAGSGRFKTTAQAAAEEAEAAEAAAAAEGGAAPAGAGDGDGTDDGGDKS